MTIASLLKQALFSQPSKAASPVDAELQTHANATNLAPSGNQQVLNVGGNSKAIAIPSFYDGWTHHLLDIDPAGKPDVLCDARTLVELPGMIYDSVYCSHNLEHYYSHDVVKVLVGFHHVLKSDGFVDIRVPDMQAVVKHMVANDMDIDDVLYQSSAGPIAIKDVMYGWGKQIEESGEDFFGHKTGFSEKSLTAVLERCGFTSVYAMLGNFEIKVFAFKHPPEAALLAKLGLSRSL